MAAMDFFNECFPILKVPYQSLYGVMTALLLFLTSMEQGPDLYVALSLCSAFPQVFSSASISFSIALNAYTGG